MMEVLMEVMKKFCRFQFFLFLKKIKGLENQEYYGIDHKNGNWVKYPLEQENIEKLLLKDKKKSTWATVGLFLGISLIATFIFINNYKFQGPTTL